MAHISIQESLPGIRGLADFRPETGKPLYDLAQVLLRNASPLSSAERELIAAYVSSLNTCKFCCNSHAAAARVLYSENSGWVDEVLENPDSSSISPKLKALLHIAGKIQQSGKAVTPLDIAQAREEGAIDREIHDTVLIAATFCMFNRYVDGLATRAPEDPNEYAAMGNRMATYGYVLTKKN